jgi:hypothetical protein
MSNPNRLAFSGAAILTSALKMAIVVAILPTTAAAAAMTTPRLTVEYSADRRVETDSGDLQGRVYAAPGMERSETRVTADMTTVMILRTDKKIGWMLMPAQKMYQELDLAKASKQSGAVTPEQTELELVGQETVSGQSANKYKFVTEDKSAGGFLWYTTTGIPVKMDVLSKSGRKSERMTVTLENIQIGTQDRALFELPKGFNRMPGAGGMFGGMGGNASPAGSGLLSGLKNAVTRPVQAEATAVAGDVTHADEHIAAGTQQIVKEEIREVGAKAKVRNALQSVGGLFRKK